MRLLVYHVPFPILAPPCRFISPISPPFNGPTGFTITGARIYQFYTVINELTGYNTLPLLPYCSALCRFTIPISPSASGPTGMPFLPFLPILSIARFIAPISPSPKCPNGFTIFWLMRIPSLHRKSLNLPDLPFYHFADFIDLCRFTPQFSQSTNEPTGLPFCHFLPILAPIQVYIAN